MNTTDLIENAPGGHKPSIIQLPINNERASNPEVRTFDMKTTILLTKERVDLLVDRAEITLRAVHEAQVEAGAAPDAPEEGDVPLFSDTLAGAIGKLEFIFGQIESAMGGFSAA
jgi:hypothetical protein